MEMKIDWNYWNAMVNVEDGEYEWSSSLIVDTFGNIMQFYYEDED